jgi:hypothetical protein
VDPGFIYPDPGPEFKVNPDPDPGFCWSKKLGKKTEQLNFF